LEAGRAWLVVAGILLFLTIGLGFAKFVAAAAAGELPVDTVLWLALYSAVKNSTLVLPISVFLAVLLTLGRLCRDNEMAAIQAGGASLVTIYRPFIVLAVCIALLGGCLSLLLVPQASRAMDQMTAETTARALRMLAAGRFRSLLDGRAVFYAARRDNDTGMLHDVFIRMRREDRHGRPIQTVVTAARARQRTEPGTEAQVLVLEDGWRYEGEPGRADYRVVEFGEHGVRVEVEAGMAGATDYDNQSLATLLASGDARAQAEMQKRLSVPLSILILTLLGLPLGRLPPRAGRYGRIGIGILLYMVYFNLLQLVINWVGA